MRHLHTVFIVSSSLTSTTKFIRRVAQSGSAPALGAGGPRFESLYADHFNADMAQLVAHIIGNDEVPSSNLGISTKGNII